MLIKLRDTATIRLDNALVQADQYVQRETSIKNIVKYTAKIDPSPEIRRLVYDVCKRIHLDSEYCTNGATFPTTCYCNNCRINPDKIRFVYRIDENGERYEIGFQIYILLQDETICKYHLEYEEKDDIYNFEATSPSGVYIDSDFMRFVKMI